MDINNTFTSTTIYFYHMDVCDCIRFFVQVSIIFRRHQDLLDEFTHFLPDTSTTAHAFHPSSGRPFGTRDDRSSAKSALRHAHIDKVEL